MWTSGTQMERSRTGRSGLYRPREDKGIIVRLSKYTIIMQAEMMGLFAFLSLLKKKEVAVISAYAQLAG